MAASISLACVSHSLSDVAELQRLRSSLLEWYDSNKRDLPWRARAAVSLDGISFLLLRGRTSRELCYGVIPCLQHEKCIQYGLLCAVIAVHVVGVRHCC